MVIFYNRHIPSGAPKGYVCFFKEGFYHGSTAVPHRAPPFRGCRCVFLGIGILPRALFYALSAQFADGLHAGGHYHFLLRLHPDAGAHSAGHFHRHHGCIQKNHHRRPFLHHSQQPWPVFDHEFCGHSAVSCWQAWRPPHGSPPLWCTWPCFPRRKVCAPVPA